MTNPSITDMLEQQTLSQLLEQFKEQQLAEDELKKHLYTYVSTKVFSTEELNKIVSRTFDIILLDEKGYLTYCDQSFAEHLGYQQDELIDHHYRMLHAKVHDNQFYNDMWQTIQQGDVWTGDIATAAKTNAVFWYRTTIIPILNGDQKPFQFIVFRTDITDVKKSDKAILEQLDDDYRKVLSHVMNLTFRVNRDKTINRYRFRLFEGKLIRKMSPSFDQIVTGHDVFFGQAPVLTYYFERAFEGEEVRFKHQYKQTILLTTLVPIIEKGQVIEVVGSSSDVTSLEEAEKKAKRLTYYDLLTDLPNREKFKRDLTDYLHHQPRDLALLICDIDKLKNINDTLGEVIGDDVIQTVVTRIRAELTDLDTLYRYGGDEFAIITTGDEAKLKDLTDRMIQAINRPVTSHRQDVFVSASIGVSRFSQDATTEEQLVRHANVAVHYCKLNGRNHTLFFSETMEEDYNENLILDADIRKALHNNEFELYYQPQINVITGEVIGLEALIRWMHPKKGPVSPAKFIPLAEESGVITQIGEWVIQEACHQHQTWVKEGYEPIRIAVNVSAIELQRTDFVEKVKTILTETNMDPQFLEIEITENSVMQNTEECILTMNCLRQMGISFSIDDFGTGYSSFGYLKQFPINYLKIDQSFVRSALKEQSSATIVKAMIQLAHNFGLRVVAEGVEDEAILSLLKAERCDFYQGYYYSKPVRALDIKNKILIAR